MATTMGRTRKREGTSCRTVTLTGVSSVTISDAPLSITDLLRIAAGSRVDLSAAAASQIGASRDVVENALRGTELIYGLNTGLGHLRNERIPDEMLIDYQDAIIASHVGGIGPSLPTEVVRAAMAVRLNGIARGGSGASQAVADMLAALLNAGVHPIVPTVGSVGDSDLMHMAAIGDVALGRGEAEYQGERLSGGEALRRAGLAPVALAPKDGLALISANGVSIGHGALVVARAAEVAEVADIVLASSLEAIGGNPSIVDPAVARAKPVEGQRQAADHVRALLSGSVRCEPGGPASVQDALSFRVGPQVHGAFRELIRLATDAVELELNASDDNPLVSAQDGRMISNGNFAPMLMALAFDALRPAIAHVGQLSDRRLSHLWSAEFGMPETMLPDGLRRLRATMGGPLWRYAAAARYTELRSLAAPATLDVGPLDMGVEDHSTNAPETVRRTDQALDVLEDILAVELAMARVAIDPAAGRIGVGAQTAFGVLQDVLDGFPPTRISNDAHAAIREALRQRVLPAVRAALSRPT
jgi:histidine ammonia-lyase